MRRDYADPPSTILRYDGKPAIGIGISTVSGGNVVTMGRAVEGRISELKSRIPLGMEISKISFQGDTVERAVNEFVWNLVAAVVIVFVVLLLAMGLRSGLLIGLVLLLTICGTMLLMDLGGVILERISLGALIIALAMLVDNAIVITEGMLVAMQRGRERLAAAKEVVAQTAWPLLGSTAIAILAFGAIGLSDDRTGEYCRSLFVVLLLALGLSWVTAVTLTPLFGYFFLKPGKSGEKSGEPFSGGIFRWYRNLLSLCMRNRGATVLLLAALLGISLWAFQFVSRSFFPDSTREQFMVDVWLPPGTRLDQTDRVTLEMLESIRRVDGVTNVTTVVGQGALRFLLTYSPERFDPSFAQFSGGCGIAPGNRRGASRNPAHTLGAFSGRAGDLQALPAGPRGGRACAGALRGRGPGGAAASGGPGGGNSEGRRRSKGRAFGLPGGNPGFAAGVFRGAGTHGRNHPHRSGSGN